MKLLLRTCDKRWENHTIIGMFPSWKYFYWLVEKWKWIIGKAKCSHHESTSTNLWEKKIWSYQNWNVPTVKVLLPTRERRKYTIGLFPLWKCCYRLEKSKNLTKIGIFLSWNCCYGLEKREEKSYRYQNGPSWKCFHGLVKKKLVMEPKYSHCEIAFTDLW